MRTCAQVEAEAITDSRPIPGFVPRQGKGLPVFGKSSNYPPKGKVCGPANLLCKMPSLFAWLRYLFL